MPGKNFIVYPYQTPDLIDAGERVKSYGEGFTRFTPEEASAAASRCFTGCDVPGCNTGCDLHQPIPQFLEMAHKRNWHEANKIAGRNSPLYGMIGAVCPEKGLCKDNCTLAHVEAFSTQPGILLPSPLKDTVAISEVEAAIWRHTIDHNGGLRYPTPLRETGKSVAVIGAGPAGIYAAFALRAKGHAVTVYDSQAEIGGLLLRGIPAFKLGKDDLPLVREAFERTGMQFRLDTRVGTDGQVALQELADTHNAVLIAIGTQTPRAITHPDTNLPIDGHEHMIPSLDFLWAHGDYQRVGTPLDSNYVVTGKRVAIIGAGDTAMDAVGTSVRDGGASALHLIVRSGIRAAYKEQNMRGEEAGIAIPGGRQDIMGAMPLDITSHDDGLMLHMRHSKGEVTRIVVDKIINAAGFDKPDLAAIFGMDIQPIGRNNPGTNVRNIFVAGDAHGATLAVTAASEGRRAGGIIHGQLMQGRLG